MNEMTEGAMNVASETVNQMQNFFHVNEIINYVKEPEHVVKFATGIIALLIFWGVYRLIRMIIKKGAAKKLEPQAVKTGTKIVHPDFKAFFSEPFYIFQDFPVVPFQNGFRNFEMKHVMRNPVFLR